MPPPQVQRDVLETEKKKGNAAFQILDIPPTNVGDSFFANSDAVRAEEAKTATDQAKATADKTTERDGLLLDKEIADLRASLAPSTSAPPAPNLAETFKRAIEEKDETGLSIIDLRTQIGEFTKQKAELLAQFGAFKRKEPEGVTAGFAQGRISAEAQNVQDRIDFVDRQITIANTQLKNRTDVISTIMDLTKEDFANASDRYDKEFANNLSLYNAVQTNLNRQEANARASLDVFRKAIEEGNLSYADLSPAQKATVDELELQAYGTRGVLALLKPGEKELDTFTDADGNRVSVFYDPATKKTRRIVLGKSGEKVPTQGQFLTAGYTSRIASANTILDDLEGDILDMSLAEFEAQRRAPNFLKSTEVQQLEQAQRNFINAVLRRESGAAIAESEFENARQQYFVQPGDKKEVVANKRANRKLVEENFAREAGTAYQPATLTPPGVVNPIQKALEEGYSESEVVNYLSGSDATMGARVKEARDAGYSDDQILDFLNGVVGALNVNIAK